MFPFILAIIFMNYIQYYLIQIIFMYIILKLILINLKIYVFVIIFAFLINFLVSLQFLILIKLMSMHILNKIIYFYHIVHNILPELVNIFFTFLLGCFKQLLFDCSFYLKMFDLFSIRSYSVNTKDVSSDSEEEIDPLIIG